MADFPLNKKADPEFWRSLHSLRSPRADSFSSPRDGPVLAGFLQALDLVRGDRLLALLAKSPGAPTSPPGKA
jgi:hypothetical protein